jgi:magnesium chelatase family protein
VQTVRVLGACLYGTGAELVTIEARFDRRDRERTEVVLTGLPDPVLRESRGRIESALCENGLELDGGRLFLNLVPAARRKSGEILDLPLALGAAAASGHFDAKLLKGALFLGELGIDGRMHAVPGGLAAAMVARAAGLKRVFAPPATAAEAACIGELQVFGARHLAQVLAHLTSNGPALERLSPPPLDTPSDDSRRTSRGTSRSPSRGMSRNSSQELGQTRACPSLDEVRGLASAKHALCVAAAGGHALLFVGPPGAGKSMLAARLVSLLPPPPLEERLEITRVLSSAGRWPNGLARERPFRAPHHTISYAGLVGGGANVAAGEITLAHRGVLFLDELPEFRREVLEALRQPMESGTILISRAARQLEMPARFQLIAAMHPCPCGYLGHPRIPCPCPPSFVQRYRRRISGPLLDRIDLCVEVTPPSLDELAPRASAGASNATGALFDEADAADGGPPAEESEAALRARVVRAIALASARQGPLRNADLAAAELDRLAPLDADARKLLSAVVDRRGLSARAVQSLRRVARTIADLEGEASVSAAHLAQALGLRAPVI